MKAILKYALTSHKKMGMIAKIVRGKKVPEALSILSVLPKRAAKILSRVIVSAAANGKNKHGYDANMLSVSEIQVGRGPKLKRMKFVGRARIHAYQRYRTFVSVVLQTS